VARLHEAAIVARIVASAFFASGRAISPIVASVIVMCGGAGLIAAESFAPFAMASSTTLLLVSGIYPTWGETLALIELSEKPLN